MASIGKCQARHLWPKRLTLLKWSGASRDTHSIWAQRENHIEIYLRPDISLGVVSTTCSYFYETMQSQSIVQALWWIQTRKDPQDEEISHNSRQPWGNIRSCSHDITCIVHKRQASTTLWSTHVQGYLSANGTQRIDPLKCTGHPLKIIFG